MTTEFPSPDEFVDLGRGAFGVLQFDINGDLRVCETCECPVISPFPRDHSIDLIKEGPREGPTASYLTPHRPGCPAVAVDGPVLNGYGREVGYAVNIPGEYTVHAHVFGFDRPARP